VGRGYLLISVSIVTGWVKLLRNVDVVDFALDVRFGGLTEKQGVGSRE
jgi:hypothetical protein